MDRFVANTLRTLGLIVVAIVVIAIAAGLALLGLCFAILASADHHGGASPQSNNAFYFGIAAAIVVLAIGVFVIGAMARVIFRQSKTQDQSQSLPPLPPYSLVPPVPTGPVPITLVPPATGQTPPQPSVVLPSAPSPTTPQRRPALDAATHLSRASRVALDRLILAIAAQASAQFIVGVIEWLNAPPVTMQRLRLHGPLLLAWNVAAIVPYVILAISLRRRPGPTAFSFCIVIPAIRSFLGFVGQTASIIIFLRNFHSGMPLFSAIPWALDVVVFVLALKAIRLTGIEPTPGRLNHSAVDIFLYSSSLPLIFLVLTYFWR